MKYMVGVLFIIATLSGCATQSFDVNPPVGPMSEPELEESQSFFVYGIAQGEVVDAAEVCGSVQNIARVETEQNALDSVLSFLTGGIYTPRTARVYCLQAPSDS